MNWWSLYWSVVVVVHQHPLYDDDGELLLRAAIDSIYIYKIKDSKYSVFTLQQPELLPAESNFLTCLYSWFHSIISFELLGHRPFWFSSCYCWSILYHLKITRRQPHYAFATRTIVPSRHRTRQVSQSIRAQAQNLSVLFIVVYWFIYLLSLKNKSIPASILCLNEYIATPRVVNILGPIISRENIIKKNLVLYS